MSRYAPFQQQPPPPPQPPYPAGGPAYQTSPQGAYPQESYYPPSQQPEQQRYSMRDSVRINGQNRYNGSSRLSGPSHRRKIERRQHKRSTSLSSQLKGHVVATLGEFVGTIMFLWFAFAWHAAAAMQNSITSPDGGASATLVLYVSIAYGFSLLVNAWCFYRISGGLFNPAVTLGLVVGGAVPPVRGLFLLPAQIIGGIVAAGLVDCMFPIDISVVNTTLSTHPYTSIVRGVFIEMFLTALLMTAIFMLAAEKSKVTFIAPLGIGLALFVAELAGVLFTGGSLNPARSFGPAVISGQWVGYHWIYWVGPGLGGLLAAGYYRLNKALGYEEANPGQDSAAGDFLPGDKV